MPGIRGKLSLGFGGLLLIIAVIGLEGIQDLATLGDSIDVILRENYRSVLATQQMKESIERLDSGILFNLLGENEQGGTLIEKNTQNFETALQAELNNITLQGEGEKAAQVQQLFSRYKANLKHLQNHDLSDGQRRKIYFEEILPLFLEIKSTADSILQMNQQNMVEANGRARSIASAAKRQMIVLLLCGTLLASLCVILTGRWILRPIGRLIGSAEEIRRGNLDLVIRSGSTDEIGRLSQAFNAMASSLRELRRADQGRIRRMERSTQQILRSLPDAVAVVDSNGQVEISSMAAAEFFGLKTGVSIRSLGIERAVELFEESMRTGRSQYAPADQSIIQRFIGGAEHFFRIGAVPVINGEREPTGVTLVFKDVTQKVHQDELKGGLISTVSHQLKTPLTSLRMAVYLLLEEKAGPITPKQSELLIGARDDCERLHSILTSLLDINRIESGKAAMSFQAVSPHELAMNQMDSYWAEAKDAGVSLRAEVSPDVPGVWADPDRIGHALGNLISNALKYTSPGGIITISAQEEGEAVRFLVSDTGAGIPEEYLDRVFDQFFRVPGQQEVTGEGLGLAIVKEIVEAHGGTVTVESHQGKGSVFSFSLRQANRIAPERHV